MRFIFDKTIEVERLSATGLQEEYVSHGSIQGIIMPVKAEDMMLTDGTPGKALKLLCDISQDLKEADRISYDGDYYTVKVIRKFEIGSLARMEAFIYQTQ